MSIIRKKVALIFILLAILTRGQTPFTAAITSVSGNSTTYSTRVQYPTAAVINSFNFTTNYPHNFSGANNRSVNYISVGGKNYVSYIEPPTVYIRRNNASGTAAANAQGLPWNDKQIFYAEGTFSTSPMAFNAITSYPGTINSTDEPALNVIKNGYINTGIDNLFSNLESASIDVNGNNIERVDYVYNKPVLVTAQNINTGGILIGNRGANDDPIVFSAIKALAGGTNTGNGTNYIYSDILRINNNWTTLSRNGGTALSMTPTSIYGPTNFIVFRERDTDGAINSATPATINPSAAAYSTNQSIYGVYFTFQNLGLNVGDYFYGFSVAANDYPTAAISSNTATNTRNFNSYLNTTYFPLTTSNTDGGVDLLLMGLYNNLSISGNIWKDLDESQTQNLPREVSTNLGGQLRVVLLDATGKVVDNEQVDASGNYILDDASINSTYLIILTRDNPAIGTTYTYTTNSHLPDPWKSTAKITLPDNSTTQNTVDLGVIQVNTGTTSIANQNFGIAKKKCFLSPITTGIELPTPVGITTLGRAGVDNDNWPMVRKGAWIALESNNKGFVINRLTDTQIVNLPSEDLQIGMMVYNITQDCLYINKTGTPTGWKCFISKTCPDSALGN